MSAVRRSSRRSAAASNETPQRKGRSPSTGGRGAGSSKKRSPSPRRGSARPRSLSREAAPTPKGGKAAGRKRSAAEEREWQATLGKVVPCGAYALSSSYMTIAQKYVVMSQQEVKALFLFYQNAAALLMFIPAYMGWLERYGIKRYAFWDMEQALKVLPLGVTYSIMLYSSNYGLSLLTVPMVSVLKNFGPIFITVAESYTDDKPLSSSTLLSMMMLVLGSVVAGYYDLKYDFWGYLSMFVNVMANLLHVQLTKRIQRSKGMKKAVVLHYQSIYMCFLLLLPLSRQDVPGILRMLLRQPADVLIAFISTGVNGVVIALCSMWCIEATSGSTYSMVGALNKIPSSILGIIIFRDPVNALNLAGVFIGLLGGIVFTLGR